MRTTLRPRRSCRCTVVLVSSTSVKSGASWPTSIVIRLRLLQLGWSCAHLTQAGARRVPHTIDTVHAVVAATVRDSRAVAASHVLDTVHELSTCGEWTRLRPGHATTTGRLVDGATVNWRPPARTAPPPIGTGRALPIPGGAAARYGVARWLSSVVSV